MMPAVAELSLSTSLGIASITVALKAGSLVWETLLTEGPPFMAASIYLQEGKPRFSGERPCLLSPNVQT